MPMVEISDDDLGLLEFAKKAGGVQGIALRDRAYALHNKLFNSEKSGKAYQDMMTEETGARTPAAFAKTYTGPLVERMDATDKKIDEFIAAQQKRIDDEANSKLQADFDSKWASVVKDHELTEEGEKLLIEHMKSHGIADPEAGAMHYFHKNPKPAAPVAPSTIAPSSWAKDMGFSHAADDADAKALIANPDQWADREAAAVLTEIRQAA